jgi:exopolysaccharide production protein ExoQ
MWVGVTTHKNSLGQLCFVVSFFLLWSLITKWREKKRGFLDKNSLIEITLLLMALWILNGSATSQSKTSIIALIIGICVFIGLSTIKKNLKHLGIYVFFIVFIGLSLQILSGLLLNDSLLSTLITSSGRSTTLTGRVPLWEELMRIGSQHSLFGAGFASFWMGDVINRLWGIFIWTPESAHNGYLDTYI